eukprot:m.277689 g.277689  ORF g.277689 m.277689 type:complete len:167 (-) comp15731_c0_seq6:239-739(-)
MIPKIAAVVLCMAGPRASQYLRSIDKNSQKFPVKTSPALPFEYPSMFDALHAKMACAARVVVLPSQECWQCVACAIAGVVLMLIVAAVEHGQLYVGWQAQWVVSLKALATLGLSHAFPCLWEPRYHVAFRDVAGVIADLSLHKTCDFKHTRACSSYVSETSSSKPL